MFTDTKAAISCRLNDPVTPYISVIPKRKNPVEKAPIMKYLNPASPERMLDFLLEARTYNEIESISRPRNSMVRFA